MENQSVSKHTISFGLAVALCSVVNALLMIAKEKNAAVMAGLKQFAGHHWTGHAVIVVALFLLFGWLYGTFGKTQTMPVNRLLAILVGSVIAGGLIIVGFYLMAD